MLNQSTQAKVANSTASRLRLAESVIGLFKTEVPGERIAGRPARLATCPLRSGKDPGKIGGQERLPCQTVSCSPVH